RKTFPASRIYLASSYLFLWPVRRYERRHRASQLKDRRFSGTRTLMPYAPFVLANGNRRAGQSNPPVTLYLTVSVSPNSASNPILPIDATNIQSTEINETPPTEATSSIAQDSTNTTRSTNPGPETYSPPTDRLLNVLMPAG
ncbi:hypothetical protein EI94DRAFT_1756176, partial [Lactarius quietus]